MPQLNHLALMCEYKSRKLNSVPVVQGRTHGAGCVRQWFRTAEPLGERLYENRNTHTRVPVVEDGAKREGVVL